MHTLCLFALNPIGFSHPDLRTYIAQLLSHHRDHYAGSQTTYDLRRLRLHGLIERLTGSHRYRITTLGAQIAMLYTRLYARGLRPIASLPASASRGGQRAFERLDTALTNFLHEVRLVA